MSDEVYEGADWRPKGDAGVDISAANPLQIRFQKPDGTIVNRTATPAGGGEDTKAYIDITASENTPPGFWKFQIYAKIGSKIHKGTTYIKEILGDFVKP